MSAVRRRLQSRGFIREIVADAKLVSARIAMVLCAMTLVMGAGTARANIDDVRRVLGERMKAHHKVLNPSTLHETLIPGLYRWDRGAGVGQIYVNEAVTLFLGTDATRIVEWGQPVRNPEPISDVEKQELLSEIIRNIRLDKLIHIRQGTGENQVLLVSAFDCPFCIKFERMLEAKGDVLNADIYILPSTLNKNSNANLSTVTNLWCADNNAAVWRQTVTKAQRGYFMAPRPGCGLSIREVEDIELLLHSWSGFKGFPYMVFGNGEAGTPSDQSDVFMSQLRRSSGKQFWAELHPERYAQFRADRAAANAPTVEINPAKPLQNFFKRLGSSATQNNGK